MAEGDGLGGLQMGEAGHHRRGMLVGAGKESGDQLDQCMVDPRKLILDPQAEIDGDLIVARARGMETAGGGADERCQPRFHIHVDVFKLARELEGTGFDLALDGAKTLGDGSLVL